MEKFLHMTDFFSTSTACGACDKYEVWWGSSIAMVGWPHPSRWCTGQIQDATNRWKMPGTAFAWIHGRPPAKGMGEIWILLPPRVLQYWCQNSEKWALLFYLAVKLWTITQAIINREGPSIAVSILLVQDCGKKEGRELSNFAKPNILLTGMRPVIFVIWDTACWLSPIFKRELEIFPICHTHCLVLHWNVRTQLWNWTAER